MGRRLASPCIQAGYPLTVIGFLRGALPMFSPPAPSACSTRRSNVLSGSYLALTLGLLLDQSFFEKPELEDIFCNRTWPSFVLSVLALLLDRSMFQKSNFFLQTVFRIRLLQQSEE